MVFTSLSQHVDLEWMKEAYRRTRKDGAVGVDGQTAEEFAQNLEANLQDLLDQAKSGRYVAPPVRRVHIPKGDGGETRPIGVPAFADKVLQRAVAVLLESVYEQDFLDCSYGFRPGRSTHQALQAFWDQMTAMGGGVVVEVDIRKYFDTLSHSHLQEILRHRVRDGVILRLIGKWLNAGVMEEGSVSYPESGSPQGGVVSPILSNIYLHAVMDGWFEKEVKPRLRGRAFMVRYADDLAIGLSDAEDARRVMAVLPKRFGKYGLALHPEKTRLVLFRPPGRAPKGTPGEDVTPGAFDLLGFTHYWGKSRKGRWIIKRRTASGRFTRALKRISEWCRQERHQPVAEQQKALNRKLSGHYSYYGITGNVEALSRFQYEVQKIWKYWLKRRSQKRKGAWDWFNRMLEQHPLTPARVVHSVYHRVANP